MATINAGVTTNVTSGVNNSNSSSSSSSSSATGVTNDTLAGNFTTFLQLLTTQLKNQNPLDPLDTNQFTQQLVQFAQVEQQMKSNDQLSSLVALQKTAQQTQALAFVGMKVAVDGQTAELKNGGATWGFNTTKPATATVNIVNSAGATVYTGTFSVNAGAQQFTWDGRSNNGVLQSDGTYTLSITAKDASGQTLGVSTETEGTVDSVDMTVNPPTLSIGGKDYTLDKVKRVVWASSTGTNSDNSNSDNSNSDNNNSGS
jgi:flagellar basal-body rod modification protein FlgD